MLCLVGEHIAIGTQQALQALRDRRARVCVLPTLPHVASICPPVTGCACRLPRDAEGLQHRSGTYWPGGSKGNGCSHRAVSTPQAR